MMKMKIRPLLPAERNYTYNQSQQISMQTGRIGNLRGDMGSNGDGFYSSWNSFRSDLNTDEFKAEFDDVINSLRFDKQYGGLLASRRSLEDFCHAHPESGFDGNYCREYGFRINTAKYAYLLRLNPTQGDYNLYCFCYVREWLDRHLNNAERGIRFITPDYDELFRVSDGEKIRITYSDGSHADRVCRYIDDYHVEVGGSLYHICELAERLEQAGSNIEPVIEAVRTRHKKDNRLEER